MVPTVRHGDLVLVRRGGPFRVGDVVIGRYSRMPDRLVVKRLVRREADGWWFGSDNPGAGGDSDAHGVADVQGRVLLRLARRDTPTRRRPGWRLERVRGGGRRDTPGGSCGSGDDQG